MKLVSEAIMNIGHNSSRTAKLTLVKKYGDIEGFKEIMKFVYDPYIRTGVGRTKLKKAKSVPFGKEITWQMIIDHFTVHKTGSDADATLARAFVDQFPEGSDEHTVAIGMVTKSLKIGVTEKSLNSVFGNDFIPLIGIMKAEKYDEYKHKVKGPFISTEKLDGGRRILVKENNVISMYSRSGIPDDGLVDILREANHLPDNCVYDGECLAIGKFNNAIELRQATNAILNRKGNRTGLTFNIFDMIPIADFKKGVSVHDARTRKIMLSAMFKDESIECLIPTSYKHAIAEYGIDYDFKFIKVVPILGVVNTEEEVMKMAEPIWRRGFEGIMLNTFTGKYDLIRDRSSQILKVKKVEEHTLTVIDVEIGRPGTENENRLGALVVEYKGNRVGVGSGLDHKMRDKWWANPGLIVGKQIEIDCFGESKNQFGEVSLNCPIFKRVVGKE